MEGMKMDPTQTPVLRDSLVARCRPTLVPHTLLMVLTLTISACTNDRNPLGTEGNGADVNEGAGSLSIAAPQPDTECDGEWGFGKGVEPPNGAVVLVGQFSGLNDSTESGRIIVDELLKHGIVPIMSGSRAVNVQVAAARAAEARRVVRSLIGKHNLRATVVETPSCFEQPEEGTSPISPAEGRPPRSE
jgi:hypothetical protein